MNHLKKFLISVHCLCLLAVYSLVLVRFSSFNKGEYYDHEEGVTLTGHEWLSHVDELFSFYINLWSFSCLLIVIATLGYCFVKRDMKVALIALSFAALNISVFPVTIALDIEFLGLG